MSLKGYEKALLAGAGVAAGALALSLLTRPAAAQGPPILFFNITNNPSSGPVTSGKVSQIYSEIAAASKGISFGLEPWCETDWADQFTYFQECSKYPVMLTAWASDNSYQITVDQIEQVVAVCPVKYLRFHEVMSYYASTINTPAVQSYIQSILSYCKSSGIPLFWNEWDTTTYPAIASLISGYEDNVLVSFGTNNINVQAGLQALQVFKRKACSVQAFYWSTLNGDSNGLTDLYLSMPPSLMAQFTLDAFQAGCEIVEYEPYLYFFYENAEPSSTLQEMFTAIG